jgi:NAD(P)H-dependent FMN reductase
MTKIAVVVGSVREGRSSDRLAKWVAEEVKNQAEVEILDLKDYPMPFMDEAISPRYNPDRQPIPEVKKWLDKVAEFDGYVFVTPEYNRTTSGVLKNAIDFFAFEIEKKPVALVGHGSSGGAQAIASLRMALPGVGAVTVPQALFFSHRVGEVVSPEGELADELSEGPMSPQTHLKGQIESLVWYADALKAAK